MTQKKLVKNKERLEHAKHNFETCNFINLHGNDKHNDWIITTAFYSALHYVSYKVFPFIIKTNLKDGGAVEVIIENNDEYFLYRSKIDRKCKKHNELIDLVYEKLGDTIGSYYERLFDVCITARYNTYNQDKVISDLAISDLNNIEKFCK